MHEADGLLAEVAAEVAHRLGALGLPGHELRERRHLDPISKDVFELLTGARPASRTLATADFPGLGPVDVVELERRVLVELKWSYRLPGKVFESAWDAVKLALLGPAHGFDALYLMTGAARAEWSASESADLFTDGVLDPGELWRRPLVPPRGPNHGATIAEDLVIGARGNRPLVMPERIALRRIAACAVVDDYELRVASIVPLGTSIAWTPPGPIGPIPGPRPPDPEFPLPARVTQAWIERTAPTLEAARVGPFLRALERRGWSQAELSQRVRPHLPRGSR